jgi:molybdopterin synthase catalytic subunit
VSELFEIRDAAFDAGAVEQAVSGPEVGGIVCFVGTVRDENEGRPVTLLEYEAYTGMAKKQMLLIKERIQRALPGVRLAVLHRVGALKVGDVAVACAAGAAHRAEAFEACRMLIDQIKAELPIWKREHGPDGPYWVGFQDARCHGHHAE